jgi:hypothetical protein
MTNYQINSLDLRKPLKEDNRSFLIRLLSSIRLIFKLKYDKVSGIRPDISIKGGTDF